MLGITYNTHVYKKTYYVNAEESLTGRVLGQTASDIEERSAVALGKLGIPFRFRMRINPLVPGGLTAAHMNVLGEVELDFLCDFKGRYWPFMIQGEISHFYAAYQKSVDAIKIDKANNFLKAYNAAPVITVPFWFLKSQDEADRLFRMGFSSGWISKFYEG